jgi:CHAT domain-containing protein
MVYDNAIDSLYQKRDYFKSLEVAEKARSRRFLDYLGNKKLSAKSKTGYRLSQQANEALESLSIIEGIMLEEAKKAGIKIRSTLYGTTRYTKRIENCQSKFRKAADVDQQFGVVYNIIPVSPKKIQKELPDNLTIVEYYLTDKSLYTWVFDQKHIYAVKQDISKENIKNLIIEMRNDITIDTSKRGITVFDGSMEGITNKYQLLYEVFIAPIENYITTHRIGIIPYGILNYLPFQAFYDGNKYLIEKYAVSYIPSLSVLEFLTKSEKKGSLKILGFGNPDLNDESLDLPATEKEVEMIKDLFPNATILKREEATEATAKRLAQQYDIIHFASHGEYIPEEPLASCIRLSSGHGEDGRLEADEIFNMNIDADLVVASACQTAVGQIGKGDEIVGLTRAFIYAGANSVLGSLWNISDKATAVLMKEFYTNITAFDKVEALRRAQIKMIQSSEYSHPFYWAAFNITGGF